MVVRARLSDNNSLAEQHLLKVDQGVESTMEDSLSTVTTKGSIVHETSSTCQANDVTSALQFSAQVQSRLIWRKWHRRKNHQSWQCKRHAK